MMVLSGGREAAFGRSNVMEKGVGDKVLGKKINQN